MRESDSTGYVRPCGQARAMQMHIKITNEHDLKLEGDYWKIQRGRMDLDLETLDLYSFWTFCGERVA